MPLQVNLAFGNVTGFTPFTPNVSATLGNLLTGSAANVTLGNVTSNISGAQSLVIQGAGGLVAAGANGAIVTGPNPLGAGIMQTRVADVEVGAQGNISNVSITIGGPDTVNVAGVYGGGTTLAVNNISGVLGAAAANVTATSSSLIPVTIVEAASATLTVSRAGGTLTLLEFNDSVPPDSTANANYLDTVSASGGTGPYQYAVITDNSPMEVDPFTGILAMVGGCDSQGAIVDSAGNVWQGPNITGVVRAQDSLGAYGYLTVNVTITARSATLASAFPDIPNLLIADPANATTSGGNVTTVNCSYNGTLGLTIVRPSGAPATTLSSVLGPDGITHPTFVYTQGSGYHLGMGSGYAGSSTLPVAFTQTGISNVSGALISVINLSIVALFRTFANISSSGGAKFENIINGSGQYLPDASSDGANAQTVNTGGTVAPPGWSAVAMSVDGNRIIGENYAGTQKFGLNKTLPQTNTFTATNLSIASTIGTGTHSSAFELAAPQDLLTWHREIIALWISRHYPVTAYVPATRFIASGRKPSPLWITDFHNYNGAPNRLGAWLGSYTYTPNFPMICGLGTETGLYVNDQFGATSNVSSMSWSAGVVSVTVSGSPGWTAGQTLLVNHTGAVPTGYNGPQVATVTGAGAYTFPLASNPGTVTTLGKMTMGKQSVFPEPTQYVDSNGHLVVIARALTAAQQAYVQTVESAYGVTLAQRGTFYPYRGALAETKNIFSQWQGYAEFKYQYPLGSGTWPDGFWWYGDAGTTQEFDLAEGYNVNASAGTCTFHSASSGAPSEVTVSFPVDNSNIHPGRFGWDWIGNLDGTNTHKRYYNRRLVATFNSNNVGVTRPMHINCALSIGEAQATDAFTPSTMVETIHYWKTYYQVGIDQTAQPPQMIAAGVISGTRGNGNTLTYTPGTWAPVYPGPSPTTTVTYMWYSYDAAASFVQIGTGLTFTDTTALGPYTLAVYEEHQNSDQTVSPNSVLVCYEPVTLPQLALQFQTTAHGQAQGTVVGWIINQANGATVTIDPADTSGNWTMDPNGVGLIAGSAFPAIGGNVTIPIATIQTPLGPGGPSPSPQKQTLTITTT